MGTRTRRPPPWISLERQRTRVPPAKPSRRWSWIQRAAPSLAWSCLVLALAGCEQTPRVEGAEATRAPWSPASVAAHFPAVAPLLASAEPGSLVVRHDGYEIELGPRRAATGPARFRSLARPIVATLPNAANGVLRLTSGQGHHVSLRRRSAAAAPCLLQDESVLLCQSESAPFDVAVLRAGAALEELWIVREPVERLGYDVALPAGWTLRASERTDSVVELRDGSDRAQLRVAVPAAWDATGAPVDVALEVDDRGVAVSVGAVDAWPVLIDPSWVDAAVPSKLRIEHTATLLLDGRVLIAGGATIAGIESSAELYDPHTGVSMAVSPLLEPRAEHSATLLRDGRVLLAGGFGAEALSSTELFDPRTAAFVAGPTLAQARGGHAAVRLDSGRVLLVGGGTTTAELYDPTTDTLATTEAMPAPMADRVAAAELPDGRVLVVGSDVGQAAGLALLFDPAGNAGSGAFATTGAPTTLIPFGHSLTTLRDGRVLLLGGCPCFAVMEGLFTSSVAELFDPSAGGGTGAFSVTGSTARSHRDPSATLLPSGEVLVTGSFDEPSPGTDLSSAEIFDPATETFAELGEPMSAPHQHHTATLLPSGDVLIFGGDQAAAELYVGGGSTGPGDFTSAGSMATGRHAHSVTDLDDGRVLIAGGEDASHSVVASAEIYDRSDETYAPVGSMLAARAGHSATLLGDDRVLLVGGRGADLPESSAELFDPSANGGLGAFTPTGSLSLARQMHTATLLPGGEVLVAGGGPGGSPLASAERYDPTAGTFTATAGSMTVPRAGHGAALLPNGKVLLVGLGSAELYDRVTDTFTATSPPGAIYPSASVVVLPNGKALVTGGTALAAELYDPDTATFSFTDSDRVVRVGHQAVALPTGGVLLVGGSGYGLTGAVYDDAVLFEPSSSTFVPMPGMSEPRTLARAALLPSGEVFIAGGLNQPVLQLPPPLATAERWSPTVGSPSWRPTITNAPASVTPGDEVVIQATGLSGPEASNGRSNASTSHQPSLCWQSRLGAGVLLGETIRWSSTSVTWRAPPTAAYGPGRLTLIVEGIASESVVVAIEVTPQGVGCRYDAQCATGFCADGVCCDRACNGHCEACLSALKGSGEDGICGDVPPELDPTDECVVGRGAPCSADSQCETLHCVDGLCCETACAAQCEACDVVESFGLCVPVVGAPHGDRPPCDVTLPDDPCDLRSCDGVTRAECLDTIGPCGAYACTPDGCLEACEGDDDCAPGHHCEAGLCEAGKCDGTLATTPDGIEVDCSPYLCRPDGSCPSSCADVHDCADPFACNLDGRCVPRPPASDFGPGCGCRVPPERGTSPWAAALLLAAAAGAMLRRRASAAS